MVIVAIVLPTALLWLVNRPAKESARSAADTLETDQIASNPFTLEVPETLETVSSNVDANTHLELLIAAEALTGQALVRVLKEMEALLLTLPPEEALQLLVDWLDRGQNASTGAWLQTSVTKELSSYPDMRVWALDLLGRIASENGSSALALEESYGILESSQSPDEWAIAMRNIAWLAPSEKARPELRQAFVRMLSREEWRGQPSAGILESFDIPVAMGDAESLPLLVGIMAGEEPTLSAAAEVALDRLSASKPDEMVRLLAADQVLLSDFPELRAGYIAKANLADPMQLQAVEGYLVREDITRAEKNHLLALLALPSDIVAPALVTEANLRPDWQARRAAAIQQAGALAGAESISRSRKVRSRFSESGSGCGRFVALSRPNIEVGMALRRRP